MDWAKTTNRTGGGNRNNVPKCSEQVWKTVRWYTHKHAANSQTCKMNLKKKSKNKLLGD